MNFQSDKLLIALLSLSILVALDYLSEASSFIVTYDSYKCYVCTLSECTKLIIGLLLNLIIFGIYGCVGLSIKIYLLTFLTTYVVSAVSTGSFDLVFCLLFIVTFLYFEQLIIPSKWVKWIILTTSLYIVGQIYSNFLRQTQWRLISYVRLYSLKNWTMSQQCYPRKSAEEYVEFKMSSSPLVVWQRCYI